MSYRIGVSSGWWGIPKTPELLGLGMKVMSIATYGVTYVQADFENTAEFTEPDVVRQIVKAVEDLNIRWGSHGEIGEFMAWESAVEVIWKQSHRRLHQYLDGLYDNFIKDKKEKYKPDYINFHASNAPPIGLFVERFRLAGHAMFDFNGNPSWEDILQNNKDLKEWFLDNLIFPIFARESGVVFENKEAVIEYAVRKIVEGEARNYEELQTKIQEKLSKFHTDKNTFNEVRQKLFDIWLEMSALRVSRGAITIEEFAYALTAKYLELKKNDSDEPLWKLFFPDKNSLEELEKEWSTKDRQLKIVDIDKGLVNLMPELVAMVAARYITGHFRVTNLPEFIIEKKRQLKANGKQWDTFYEKNGIEKLNIVKVIFTFENPEILEGQREGLQRIIHARDIYYLVRAFNSKYFGVWFDSEHYVHNGLDPLREIEDTPHDFGHYVVGFHVGAPKPYHPVHEPIDVGSDAQQWIYKYAFELRKKGFGKTKEQPGLIIFERGGRPGSQPGEWMRTSAIAMRLIVEQLEKDIDPKHLPLEFFGVSSEGFLSPDRQRQNIIEHALDPLKGMMSISEEEFGFLSTGAIEGKRKRPEDWKKEALR